MAVGGPLVRRFFWGPRAGVGIAGGLNILHSSGVLGAPPTRKQNIRELCISKVGVDEACVNRGERPPRVAICIGFLAPIIRFWAPAGILKYPTEHDGN